MKRKFSSHAEVCHIWAQQCQEEGEATNVFFRGPVIYSYGHHYPMACIHGRTVLINSSGYSVSTAKHTGHVRSAVSHYATIDCPIVNPESEEDHAENLKHFADTVTENQKKALRARTRGEWYRDAAIDATNDYNAYIELFSLKLDAMDASALFDEATMERIAAQVKKESDAARRRAAERREWENNAMEDWRRGARGHDYFMNHRAVELRIKDGNVETSHGARVSIPEARRLAEALNAGEDVSGYKLEYYTVRSWDGVTLVIGCHRIPAGEVKRMSAALIKGE